MTLEISSYMKEKSGGTRLPTEIQRLLTEIKSWSVFSLTALSWSLDEIKVDLDMKIFFFDHLLLQSEPEFFCFLVLKHLHSRCVQFRLQKTSPSNVLQFKMLVETIILSCEKEHSATECYIIKGT